MAEKGARYFEERDAELRAAGLDPDDDDVWCLPDDDEEDDFLGAYMDLMDDPWGDEQVDPWQL